jgi:hypothetical protein
MVVEQNPFLFIVPRKKEEVINQEFAKDLKRTAKECLRRKELIILEGAYGSGRTLYSRLVEKDLKRRKVRVHFLRFSQLIHDEIRTLPTGKRIFVIIDDFDLSDAMKDSSLREILRSIIERTKLGTSFMIACTPDTRERLLSLEPELSIYARVLKIPPLSFERTKDLVISRLNEVRRRPSKSLEPFTEKEIEDVWRRADGNARLILLICSSLYDIKMGGI